MSPKTPRLERERRATAQRALSVRIVKKLQAEGCEAVWAGGCVRDHLLGRRPHDYDVATSAHPDRIQELFPRTLEVGKAFGVVIVVEKSVQVEVATFRGESGYRDGRRPTKVYYSDAREDAKRRDFTINGIFEDPVKRRVLDFVGGRKDLRARRIRAIGDPIQRFREDHLRLLRAVRLATTLDFKIEPKTWAALKKLAPLIRRISAERIRDELDKILTSSRAPRGLQLLSDSGLLKAVLPEVAAMQGVEHSPDYHPEGDVWVHTGLVLSKLPANKLSKNLAWAALLHDVGKPRTQEKKKVQGEWRWRFPAHAEVGAKIAAKMLARLKWPRAEAEQVSDMVRNHMTFKDVQAMRVSTLKRLMARPTFADELQLHRADCLGSHGMLDNYRFLLRRGRELGREEIRPKPLARGQDVMALGVPEGPEVGRLLRALEEKQLEGELRTREEALKWLQEQVAGSRK